MELKRQVLLPREKADMLGLHSLQDYELLALLLETGTKAEDVLTMSMRILREKGGLYSLLMLSYCEMSTYGIKRAKIYRLLTIGEIIRRLPLWNSTRISSLTDFYYTYRSCFFGGKKERVLGVQVDSKGRVLDVVVFGTGTDDRVSISSEAMYNLNLQSDTFGLILCHNHPSGSIVPSQADDQATSMVAEVMRSKKIYFIDSIIFGHDSYFSYRRCKKECLESKKSVDG